MKELQAIKEEFNELIEKAEKIIEKYKEKNIVWKPKKNEAYYYLLSYGEVDVDSWCDERADFERYETGNCFETEEEAEKALEKAKIYTQLKRLAEEINTEPIDWENGTQEKHYIYYDYEVEDLLKYIVTAEKDLGQIYCTNEKFYEAAIERIGKEKLIKLYK